MSLAQEGDIIRLVTLNFVATSARRKNKVHFSPQVKFLVSSEINLVIRREYIMFLNRKQNRFYLSVTTKDTLLVSHFSYLSIHKSLSGILNLDQHKK